MIHPSWFDHDPTVSTKWVYGAHTYFLKYNWYSHRSHTRVFLNTTRLIRFACNVSLFMIRVSWFAYDQNEVKNICISFSISMHIFQRVSKLLIYFLVEFPSQLPDHGQIVTVDIMFQNLGPCTALKSAVNTMLYSASLRDRSSRRTRRIKI